MKTFLAISTGQNVANVLPIIESWEPGDRLLWLESALARKRHWSVGALDVLHHRGLAHAEVERLNFGEHPDSLLKVLRKSLRKIDSDHSIVWIGNGGTKPQALAVEQALAAWGGHYVYVYSAHQPAGYEAFPENLAGDRVFSGYRNAPLQLEELLTISGHVMAGARRPERLWPGPEPRHDDGGYGIDPEATFRDCEQRIRWREAKRSAQVSDQLSLPRMHSLRKQDSEAFSRWWGKMTPQWRALCKQLARNPRPWGQFDSVSNAVISLAERGYRRGREAERLRQAARPSESGGQLFERAVARRLYAWLEAPEREPIRQIVTGVWANVRIARREAPERVVQELDLALLLSNGVLLVIECKAGQFEVKDLDARLLNMQASASLASAMAVAVPAYTDYRDRPGGVEMVERWKRLQALPRFRPLPFTLPGQPDSWKDPKTGEPVDVPGFEQVMEEWLRPYIP